MPKHRPRYTNKDDNHHIVTDFMRYGCGGFTEAPKEIRGSSIAYTANYHGKKFLAMDCANYGGVFVDWFVTCVDNGNTCWIEVKTPEAYKQPEHGVTPGEAWLMHNTGNVIVAVTTEDIQEIFEAMSYE